MDIQHEIDKDNMLGVIKDSSEQLVAGLELGKDIKLDKRYDAAVLSGMGGSALVGELLQIYLNGQFHTPPHQRRDPSPSYADASAGRQEGTNPVKIYINRSYNLPPESYEPGCLNIISSYSGNTEETLSCLDEALKNNLNCLGIGSGGELADVCREKNIPFVEMPVPSPTFQPRCATGYSFSALLQVFANSGLTTLNAEIFKNAAEKIKADINVFSALGEDVAKKLANKTPVVYAPVQFKALAMIWKIMFNENTKTPAFWNFFPELSHNEMVGFTEPQGPFYFLLLRDKNDHPKNLKRLEITGNIFKEYGIESTVIDIPEGEIVYRIFAALQIGSFTSYHLALNYGIDPTPVEMVEKLKKMLST